MVQETLAQVARRATGPQPVVCLRFRGSRGFEVPLSGETLLEKYGRRLHRGGMKHEPVLKTYKEARALAAKILRENPDEDDVTVWARGDEVVECRPLGDIHPRDRWALMAGTAKEEIVR